MTVGRCRTASMAVCCWPFGSVYEHLQGHHASVGWLDSKGRGEEGLFFHRMTPDRSRPGRALSGKLDGPNKACT